MDEYDVFHYAGDDPDYEGWMASSLEARNHPLKYKVEAFDPKQNGFFHKGPVRTFYYTTWVGFLTEWKRVSVR